MGFGYPGNDNLYASPPGSHQGKVTLNWKFHEEEPIPIFRDKANYFVEHQPGNAEIKINFTPRNSVGDPVTLECLAHELGVEEFNWISRVTHFPESWTNKKILYDAFEYDANGNRKDLDIGYDSQNDVYRQESDGRPVFHTEVVGSMVDLPPVPSGRQTAVFTYVGAGGEHEMWDPSESKTNLAHDSHDYYYGLGEAPSNFGVSLLFRDKPIQDATAFLPGEYLEFETELVGVNEDGTPGVRGLKIRWKSNATGANTGQVFEPSFGGFDNPVDPRTLLSGGVFDVSVVSDSHAIGDFNSDGVTDGADFLMWQRESGLTAGINADANGDSLVDGLDLAVWRQRYGSLDFSIAANASVPEPRLSSMLSATLASMCFVKRRLLWS